MRTFLAPLVIALLLAPALAPGAAAVAASDADDLIRHSGITVEIASPDGTTGFVPFESVTGLTCRLNIVETTTGSDKFHTNAPGHKSCGPARFEGPVTADGRMLADWITASTTGKRPYREVIVSLILGDGSVYRTLHLVNAFIVDYRIEDLSDADRIGNVHHALTVAFERIDDGEGSAAKPPAPPEPDAEPEVPPAPTDDEPYNLTFISTSEDDCLSGEDAPATVAAAAARGSVFVRGLTLACEGDLPVDDAADTLLLDAPAGRLRVTVVAPLDLELRLCATPPGAAEPAACGETFGRGVTRLAFDVPSAGRWALTIEPAAGAGWYALTVAPDGDGAPPTAAFTVAPGPYRAGRPVAFTDGSADDVGDVRTWAWDFGDGSVCILHRGQTPGVGCGAVRDGRHPTRAYGASGDYRVTLTVVGDDGRAASASRVVRVTDAPPVARFTWSPHAAALGEPINFTDRSADGGGGLREWSWRFGDAATSEERHPSYAFARSGRHSVTLTVTDEDGATDSWTEHVTVGAASAAPAALVARFTQHPAAAALGAPIEFRDASAAPESVIASWAWDFGDGATATGPSAEHAFAEPGVYRVTLTVTDAAGATDAWTQDVVVANRAPVPGFEVSSSPEGRAVTFTDTSVDLDGSIVRREWDFGDGTHASCGAEVCEHDDGAGVAAASAEPAAAVTKVYAEPGTYRVKLTVTDDAGASVSSARTVLVEGSANLPPEAGFRYSAEVLAPGELITFNDTSTDPDSRIVAWRWDFDDGRSATTRNATHAYLSPRNYHVKLTVTDDAGDSSQHTRTVPIPWGLTGNANVQLDVSAPAFVTGAPVEFKDETEYDANELPRRRWEFGDGATATTWGDTTHVYSSPGTYTARLSVRNMLGREFADTQAVTIVANTPPVAEIRVEPTRAFLNVPVTFRDASRDPEGAPLERVWTLDGERLPTSEESLSRTFTQLGAHEVSLRVADNAGAVATASVTVEVVKDDFAPSLVGASVHGGLVFLDFDEPLHASSTLPASVFSLAINNGLLTQPRSARIDGSRVILEPALVITKSAQSVRWGFAPTATAGLADAVGNRGPPLGGTIDVAPVALVAWKADGLDARIVFSEPIRLAAPAAGAALSPDGASAVQSATVQGTEARLTTKANAQGRRVTEELIVPAGAFRDAGGNPVAETRLRVLDPPGSGDSIRMTATPDATAQVVDIVWKPVRVTNTRFDPNQCGPLGCSTQTTTVGDPLALRPDALPDPRDFVWRNGSGAVTRGVAVSLVDATTLRVEFPSFVLADPHVFAYDPWAPEMRFASGRAVPAGEANFDLLVPKLVSAAFREDGKLVVRASEPLPPPIGGTHAWLPNGNPLEAPFRLFVERPGQATLRVPVRLVQESATVLVVEALGSLPVGGEYRLVGRHDGYVVSDSSGKYVGATDLRVQGTARDLQPPAWPAQAALTLSSDTAGGLKVTWPAATDNDAVQSYTVRAEAVGRQPVHQVVGGGVRDVDLDGLPTDVAVTVTVVAKDAAGLASAILRATRAPKVDDCGSANDVSRLARLARASTFPTDCRAAITKSDPGDAFKIQVGARSALTARVVPEEGMTGSVCLYKMEVGKPRGSLSRTPTPKLVACDSDLGGGAYEVAVKKPAAGTYVVVVEPRTGGGAYRLEVR